MIQLNLLSNKTCTHCKQNPGFKPRNPQVWNGFYDQDTGELVCWNCKEIHYTKKQKTEHKNLYSETPILAL